MKKWIFTSFFLLLAINPAARAQNGGGLDGLKPDYLSKRVAGATRELPFVNSLGMKFVPVPGTKVLFGIWDTRVQDFREFARATAYVQGGGIYVTKIVRDNKAGDSLNWELDPNASWEKPGFKQGPDYPVVGITWDEAKAFCAWLTATDRKAGLIGPAQSYRLPTYSEWDAAVGKSKYPWGSAWPPPHDAGNYADDAFAAWLPGKGWPHIPGNDGYAWTSPVGAFKPNRLGLYDMGGNVWQWCEDFHPPDAGANAMKADAGAKKDDAAAKKVDAPAKDMRSTRGGSWRCQDDWLLLSTARYDLAHDCRDGNIGFRCVLVTGAE